MKKLLLYGIVGVVIAAVLVIAFLTLSGGHQGHQKYHCPMTIHTYISDKPGDCPICGMRLVPMEKEDHSMHSSNDAEHVSVKISPEKQQLIGVKKEKGSMRHLEKTIHAAGRIEYAEPGLSIINTKFSGWIKNIYVDTTGQFVKKGEPLFSIYSPELVSAEQEYLTALETKKKAEEMNMPEGNMDEMVKSAEQLISATKQKLLFWDITEAQIDELAKQGEPFKVMTINSPAKGFVIKKEALAGKFLMPGELLYQIADLATVWLDAEIYEYEIPYVKVGDRADIEFSYYPGEKFSGKITYIYPYLNPAARTVTARIELPNPDYKIKIDMYANVNLKVDLGKRIAVPIDAVLDSGRRQMVFVDKGEGLFEPREVTLGAKTEDYYEVTKGIAEGEVVITSANFLIDAESKMKAAIGGMGAEHKSHEENK